MFIVPYKTVSCHFLRNFFPLTNDTVNFENTYIRSGLYRIYKLQSLQHCMYNKIFEDAP